MWCSRVQKLLSAHVDGELSPAIVRRVEEHLACCERCSREHTSLRRLTRLTALIPDEDLPIGLQARILSSLSTASTAPASRVAPRRVAGGLFAPWTPFALAGMAAAAVVGFVATNSQPGQPPQVAHHASEAPLPREAAVPPTPHVVVRVEPQAPVAEPRPEGERKVAERALPHAAPRARHEEEREIAPRVRVTEEPATRQVADTRRRSRPVVPAVKVERRSPRTQPAVIASSTAAREKRAAEAGPATAVVSPQNLLPLPAEPMTVASSEATQPQPVTTGMEGDGVTRMAGATVDGAMPAQEEDGLNSLRMYLQERNQAVPQPTLLPNPQRRMRKL